MPLAHIAGIPVEEFVPAVYGAAGVWAAVKLLPARLAARRARRR
ncbi:MAG: hypothetical protein AB7G37_17545 [Solirubrobacteraceae bacterium]